MRKFGLHSVADVTEKASAEDRQRPSAEKAPELWVWANDFEGHKLSSAYLCRLAFINLSAPGL